MLAIQVQNASTVSFPVWKTLLLDSHGMPARYEKALDKQNIKIGNLAADIVSTVRQKSRIDLVLVSVADLGFASGTSYKDVCARAASLGLALCVPETALALRLEYRNQPVGEIVRIAMEPMVCGEGHRGILTVEQRRASSMVGWWRAHPDDHFQPTFRLVFVLSS